MPRLWVSVDQQIRRSLPRLRQYRHRPPRMIVGLGHQARVGKDTAGQILTQYYGFTRMAFADILKSFAYALDPIIVAPRRLSHIVDTEGWERGKEYPEVRRFLQVLGTEGGREHLGENVWVDPVMRQVQSQPGLYVITDVRFPNEFDAISEAGGFLIKLTREGSGTGKHSSETALDGARWDRIIQNDGTINDLKRAIASALGLN